MVVDGIIILLLGLEMGEIYKIKQSLWVRIFPLLFSVLFIGAFIFDKDWKTLLVAVITALFAIGLILAKMEYVVRVGREYIFSVGINSKWRIPLDSFKEMKYSHHWDANDGISFETIIECELKEGVEIHKYAQNVYFFDKFTFYDSGYVKSFEYRVSFVDVLEVSPESLK